MDRGTWQDSLWGLKELDTTEQLSIGTSTIAIASFRISFFCGGKYNYFSMLCQFLLYKQLNQLSESAICTHVSPPSWTSLPPSRFSQSKELRSLQNHSFTALKKKTTNKKPCTPPPSFPAFSLAIIYLFTVLMVLPFPEGPLFGITWFVGSSDWFLSLRIMHLSFLHVFSWLDSSFLFISMYRCTTV